MNAMQLRIKYLKDISKIIDVPQLKSYYRADRNTFLEMIDENRQSDKPSCPKCQLNSSETQLQRTILPQRYKHLLRKYERKTRLTNCQSKQFKQLYKRKQKLVIKCSTCKHTVSHILNKPKPIKKQNEIIEILDSPKKRKRKDMLAGINLKAFESTRAELHSYPIIDYISIDDSPCVKRAKHDNVIEIDHNSNTNVVLENTTKISKKKGKKKNEVKEKVDDINFVTEMKCKVKKVKETRSNLPTLTTKKEKKKLKNKLKKLQDQIRNIEHHNNKPKSSLKDFLETISV